MPPGHIEKVIAHAEQSLIPLRREASSRAELLKLYRTFIKKENHRIRLLHRAGGTGLEVSGQRSKLIDFVLNDLYAANVEEADPGKGPSFTLMASGGYGRGYLNPGSDIDLLFLLPKNSRSIRSCDKEIIEQMLMMLYDVGFKVGHAVRSISEACKFANEDHQTKTSLLDARFVAGDPELFDEFETVFQRKCIEGFENKYLAKRSNDIRSRHKKYGRTVHLQEPNVKESCGGLRDYHNLIWVMMVQRKTKDLRTLSREGLLTVSARKELTAAYEFLMRVRNALHYSQKRSASDVLTLRLQGIIATAFNYQGRTIIKRAEGFMREYYMHTRNMFQHTTSVMQSLELEVGDRTGRIPALSFLANRSPNVEKFDGFFSKGGLIFPETVDIFEEEPNRMMRAFLHIQQRSLNLSPPIRKLFKSSFNLINHPFRMSRSNRETFEEILQHPGEVAHILRMMHRVGFLGRYLPEFGELTDLVQHEFFHRYTADEHTLRCIEQLDELATTSEPKELFFKQLLQDLEDPYILYVALIMHDTGRAEGVRVHEDASATLASRVAKRLRITGDRRSRLIFLVDHHLTFWRTATTQNIDDPATIADFARAVKNRRYLQALYLFTYVDSRGTNEEAWNDWKAMLMRQLYQSTCAYFDNAENFSAGFQKTRVDAVKETVRGKLPEHYREEVEAHFENMPERYFRFRGSTSIVRNIKGFHQFLRKHQSDPVSALVPILRWEARPDGGYSLLEVYGWNRDLLLAKVAGALAARGLNILGADFFTRNDSLVLDIFRVCTTDFRPVTNPREIERVERLVKAAFDPNVEADPAELRGLIERANEAARSQYLLDPEIEIPQRAFTSNDLSPDFTILEIQARDRIGLLYDIFHEIGQLGVSVVHARISTQAGAAIDRLYLQDQTTRLKIAPRARLREIEQKVLEVMQR